MARSRGKSRHAETVALHDEEGGLEEHDEAQASRKRLDSKRRASGNSAYRGMQQRPWICRACHNMAICLFVSGMLLATLLALDEVFMLEVCHTNLQDGVTRTCQVLAVKNHTLEAVHAATMWTDEQAHAAWDAAKGTGLLNISWVEG